MTVERSSIWSIIQTVDCDGFAYAADGERLTVARPRRPHVALAAVRLAMDGQDSSPHELPDDDYTIVGWLGADGVSVVDGSGNRIGALQPGDSLVSLTKPRAGGGIGDSWSPTSH
jgi:hypothetical protein